SRRCLRPRARQSRKPQRRPSRHRLQRRSPPRRNLRQARRQSRNLRLPYALIPAARITLPHFSVSAATCAPNCVGLITSGAGARLAKFALTPPSARPAFISRLSRLTTSAGVPLGAPSPIQPSAV